MYNMDTLTRNELVDMIKNGNDSHDNQIRIKENGDIFLLETNEPNRSDDIRFYFQTFPAGDDLVGPDAARDENFIETLYKALTHYWAKGSHGPQDNWNIFRPQIHN